MQTTPTSLPPDPTVTNAPTWRVTVSADNGPLLLARVLQKFAVPEIELLAAHYTREVPDGTAEVHLDIRAQPNRARLAAVRLRNLLQVRRVELDPIEQGGTH